jgi:catalase (peroxidase I)
VKEFIKLLDIAVGSEHKVAAQWLRLSFHDAGTFNQVTGEGGANGCLMYHPDMRNEPENGHLDVAINTLEAIKNNWALLNNTCIDVSGADAIQFAGLFAAVRQTDTPGITPAKIAQLLKFEWGRPDESSCKVDWCRNLPDFALGTEDVLPTRCMMAGKEIKNKMMDRNGFTSEEATALIGAHTIGLIRNKFGPVFAAPWVENGADDFTQDGPVFSNSYFGFLENKIIANSTTAFGLNPAPFNKLFPTWVQTAPTNGTKLNYLDTDLVLAFPPRNASDHPDYHVHTAAFSNDRTFFLTTFYKAMTKMGKLGVNNTLNVPSSCTACKVNAESVTESVTDKVVDDVSNAVSAAEGTITDAQEVQQEAIINRTTVTQVFILTDNSTNAVEVSSSPSTQ